MKRTGVSRKRREQRQEEKEREGEREREGGREGRTVKIEERN